MRIFYEYLRNISNQIIKLLSNATPCTRVDSAIALPYFVIQCACKKIERWG